MVMLSNIGAEFDQEVLRHEMGLPPPGMLPPSALPPLERGVTAETIGRELLGIGGPASLAPSGPLPPSAPRPVTQYQVPSQLLGLGRPELEVPIEFYATPEQGAPVYEPPTGLFQSIPQLLAISDRLARAGRQAGGYLGGRLPGVLAGTPGGPPVVAGERVGGAIGEFTGRAIVPTTPAELMLLPLLELTPGLSISRGVFSAARGPVRAGARGAAEIVRGAPGAVTRYGERALEAAPGIRAAAEVGGLERMAVGPELTTAGREAPGYGGLTEAKRRAINRALGAGPTAAERRAAATARALGKEPIPSYGETLGDDLLDLGIMGVEPNVEARLAEARALSESLPKTGARQTASQKQIGRLEAQAAVKADTDAGLSAGTTLDRLSATIEEIDEKWSAIQGKYPKAKVNAHDQAFLDEAGRLWSEPSLMPRSALPERAGLAAQRDLLGGFRGEQGGIQGALPGAETATPGRRGYQPGLGEQVQEPAAAARGAEAEARLVEAATTPSKPVIDMTYKEVKAARITQQNIDRNGEEIVFGVEGARRYGRAQRTANSPHAPRSDQDAALRIIDEMESGLTSEQERILFGIGETGPSAEELYAIEQAMGALAWESPQALGDSLKWAITKVDPTRNPLDLAGEELVAYMQIKHAFTEAQLAGWDTHVVSEAALRGAASRFAPEDIETMLGYYRQPKPAAAARGAEVPPPRLPAEAPPPIEPPTGGAPPAGGAPPPVEPPAGPPKARPPAEPVVPVGQSAYDTMRVLGEAHLDNVDLLRAFSERSVDVPVISNLTRLVNPSAAARENPALRAFIEYKLLQEVQAGELATRLAALPPAPFKADEKGVLNIGGRKVAFGDVFEAPAKFPLSTEQKNWIRMGWELLDDYAGRVDAAAAASEVTGQPARTIRRRTFAEGEHYWPRFIEDEAGRVRVGGGVGRKQGPELPRIFDEMTQGVEAGKRYVSQPTATLELFVRAMQKREADIGLLRRLNDLGVGELPSARVSGEVATRLVKAKVEMARASSSILAIQRALRGERLPVGTIKAIEDTFPDLAGDLRASSRFTIEDLIAAGERAGKEGRVRLPPVNAGTIHKLTAARVAAEEAYALRKTPALREELMRLKRQEGFVKFRFSEEQAIREKTGMSFGDMMDNPDSWYVLERSPTTLLVGDRKAALGDMLKQIRGEPYEAISSTGMKVVRYRGGMIEPLGQEVRTAQQSYTRALELAGLPKEGETLVQPFGPRIFTDAEAEILRAQMAYAQPAIRTLATVNAIPRTMITGVGDVGQMLIQMSLFLYRNPVGWSKAVYRGLENVVAPGRFREFLASPMMKAAASHGVDVGRSEFFAGIAPLERIPGVAQVVRGTQRGFEGMLSAARAYYYDGLAPAAVRSGGERELYHLGRYTNTALGTPNIHALGVSATQQAAEAAFVFFAPRYTRSVPGLMAHMFSNGFTAREARRAMMQMILGGAATYIGIGLAMGRSQEEILDGLNPQSGKRFMSYKIGPNWYGFGGAYRAFIKFGGDLAAGDEWESVIRNPISNFVRSRTSPMTGSLVDLLEGEDFIGRDTSIGNLITDPADLGQYGLRRFTPMMVQAYLEAKGGTADKAAAVVSQALGLRQSPETMTEARSPSLRSAIDLYYEAYDEAFKLLKQEGASGVFAPVVRESKNYDEFRQLLRSLGYDRSDIARVEAQLGFTDLVQGIKRTAVRRDPALVDYLEEQVKKKLLSGEDAYGVPKYLTELADQLRNRPVGVAP